jgi:peptidoglycan-associated lipoprotein
MKKLVYVVVAFVCVGLIAGCASQQKKPKAAKTTAGLQRIHFDFDRSNIKPEYEPALKGNADWMKSNAKSNVTVEGHCDERGSVEYNIALGDRRANSAKGYMVNLGVSSGRLSTVSYGKERPLCTQHDESCWWQNRRAEFVAK